MCPTLPIQILLKLSPHQFQWCIIWYLSLNDHTLTNHLTTSSLYFRFNSLFLIWKNSFYGQIKFHECAILHNPHIQDLPRPLQHQHTWPSYSHPEIILLFFNCYFAVTELKNIFKEDHCHYLLYNIVDKPTNPWAYSCADKGDSMQMPIEWSDAVFHLVYWYLCELSDSSISFFFLSCCISCLVYSILSLKCPYYHKFYN